jgi:hypothetical protein
MNFIILLEITYAKKRHNSPRAKLLEITEAILVAPAPHPEQPETGLTGSPAHRLTMLDSRLGVSRKSIDPYRVICVVSVAILVHLLIPDSQHQASRYHHIQPEALQRQDSISLEPSVAVDICVSPQFRLYHSAPNWHNERARQSGKRSQIVRIRAAERRREHH